MRRKFFFYLLFPRTTCLHRQIKFVVPHTLAHSTHNQLLKFFEELFTDPRFREYGVAIDALKAIVCSNLTDIFITFVSQNLNHPDFETKYLPILSEIDGDDFIFYVIYRAPEQLLNLFTLQKHFLRGYIQPPIYVRKMLLDHSPRDLPEFDTYIVSFYLYFNPSDFLPAPSDQIKSYCLNLLHYYCFQTADVKNQLNPLFSLFSDELVQGFVNILEDLTPSCMSDTCRVLAPIPTFAAFAFKNEFQPILKYCNIQKLNSEYPELFCS